METYSCIEFKCGENISEFSRIYWQMEIESILAAGCENSLRELITVKSDWNAGKKDLLIQMFKNGKYNFPKDVNITSRTKDVVSTIIDFLKD